MSATYLRTVDPDGFRTLHRNGCHRVTLRHWLLRRVRAWRWAETQDVRTLLAVTHATRVHLCPACAPLPSPGVPEPRRLMVVGGSRP